MEEMKKTFSHLALLSAACFVLLISITYVATSRFQATLDVSKTYDVAPYMAMPAVYNLDAADCALNFAECILRTRAGDIVSYKRNTFATHILETPANAVSCTDYACYSISANGITNSRGDLVVSFGDIRPTMGDVWNFQCLERNRCIGVSARGCLLVADLNGKSVKSRCSIPLLGRYEAQSLACNHQIETTCMLVYSRGLTLRFDLSLRVARTGISYHPFGSGRSLLSTPFYLTCPDIGCALMVGDKAVFWTRRGWDETTWSFNTRVVQAVCIHAVNCFAINQDGEVFSFNPRGETLLASIMEELKIRSGDTAVQSLKCSEFGTCVAIANSNNMVLFNLRF